MKKAQFKILFDLIEDASESLIKFITQKVAL